jgi:hypothetical protein
MIFRHIWMQHHSLEALLMRDYADSLVALFFTSGFPRDDFEPQTSKSPEAGSNAEMQVHRPIWMDYIGLLPMMEHD